MTIERSRGVRRSIPVSVQPALTGVTYPEVSGVHGPGSAVWSYRVRPSSVKPRTLDEFLEARVREILARERKL